jgi:GTPase SAR1 family protein
MNVEYVIKAPPTQKDKIKQPELAEAGVIPKLNTSTLIIGKSGSGKSVLMNSLLTDKRFYDNGRFFDRVILISPTGESDDIQRAMKIDSSLIFTDMCEAEEALRVLEKIQEEDVKQHGAEHANKILVILDDVASHQKFLKSEPMISLFIRSRHYNCTVYCLSQYFKLIPKTIRLQCSTLIFFACSNTESDCLAEEQAPPNVKKKNFCKLIDDALRERYSFLTVSLTSPWESRFRRGLAMVINLDDYR